MNTCSHFRNKIPCLFLLRLFASFRLLTSSLPSICLSFSLHTVTCCCVIWAFSILLQDVFKEARSHDHMEAKNDMETHIRSRKLPLTRKIYAFYHAPIVKFWSNTVWRIRKGIQTHTHTAIYNHLLWLFIRVGFLVISSTKRWCCHPGAVTWHRFFALKRTWTNPVEILMFKKKRARWRESVRMSWAKWTTERVMMRR